MKDLTPSCCLLLLLALGTSSAAGQSTPEFIRGADLSSLYRLERAGAVFTDGGVPRDALSLLQERGMNAVRLRLWHTPASGTNGLTETVQMAARIKAQGLALLLDFHYSDTWADPGRQTKPAAWGALSFELLKDSVRAYTRDVISALKEAEALPDMVQLGNEIIGGMLWPEGRLQPDNATQWTRFTDLLKAANEGLVEALDPEDHVEVMIHIDRGGRNDHSRWFFDNLTNYGVPFDVIGQSFYPWWHGTLSQLSANLNDLANRYGKHIVVAEMAYPWTLQWNDNVNNIVGEPGHVHAGYPATVSGQTDYLQDLRGIVESVPNGLGRGFFYWEAAWITAPSAGSPWENVTLFNFSGEVLSSSEFLRPALTNASPELPGQATLIQDVHVYPNPAGDLATITYRLAHAAAVDIRVYDLLGREVRTPFASALMPAGIHRLPVDMDALSKGIYFYRISAGTAPAASGTILLGW